MNRYIGIFAAFCVCLASPIYGYAQITLAGTTDLRPGKVARVTLTQADGLDLQIQFLRAGIPYAGEEWSKLKDFDGRIMLWGELAEDETGPITIVVSINKDGKTFTAFHVIASTKPGPKPTPKPEPTGLAAELQAIYRVSPDAAALPKLIDTLQQVRDTVSQDKIANNGAFETTLADTSAKVIGDDVALRTLRDRVSLYILKGIGPLPSQWNKTTTLKVLDDLITALRSVK